MRTETQYLDIQVTLDKTVYRSVLSEALVNIFKEYPAFKMVMDSRLLNRMFCRKGQAASLDCKGRTIHFRVSEDLGGTGLALEFIESLAAEYGRLAA